MKFCLNTKTIQESSCIGFCFPSVHLCEFAFQLTGADTVLVCKVFFCIDGILFLHDLIKSLVTHDNGVQYCIGIIFKVVLLQEGETLSRCDHDITLGRLQLSGKDFKESRFTCSVGSDETVAVSFCKFDIYVFEKGFLAHT